MTPYYDDGQSTIYHCDCRDVLSTLTYDFVVTDPPYGTGGRTRNAPGQGKGLSHSVVHEDWDHGDLDWLGLIPLDVPILTFWPTQGVWDLGAKATGLGRDRVRFLVWRKPDPMPTPKRFVQFTIEPAWCLFTGPLPMSDGTDLFTHTSIKGNNAEVAGHPYQKPLKVMRWLVDLARGDIILDPFMGSGTTLRAAKDLGRRAIGIDTDERWCEVAARRLGQEVLDFGGAA